MWIVVKRRTVKVYRPYYYVVKRIFEIIICLSALPFLLPVFFAIAVAVRWESPGPVFFIQERIGKGGRRFGIIKFRTMFHNIDDSQHRTFMKAYINGTPEGEGVGQLFKPFSKNQVTGVGRILRK